jgi:hypothetical protein
VDVRVYETLRTFVGFAPMLDFKPAQIGHFLGKTGPTARSYASTQISRAADKVLNTPKAPAKKKPR